MRVYHFDFEEEHLLLERKTPNAEIGIDPIHR